MVIDDHNDTTHTMVMAVSAEFHQPSCLIATLSTVFSYRPGFLTVRDAMPIRADIKSRLLAHVCQTISCRSSSVNSLLTCSARYKSSAEHNSRSDFDFRRMACE